VHKYGRIAKVKGNIFIEYMLVNPSIFFEHEKVIAAADHQNPPDPVLHQEIKGGIRKIIGVDIAYVKFPGHTEGNSMGLKLHKKETSF